MRSITLRTATFLAAALASTAMLLGGTTQSSKAQFCVTTLPVHWSLGSYYAASYSDKMYLYVRTDGPQISGLNVSLSTFGGSPLGHGSLSYPLTGGATIPIKLRYPMQPGRFTLYFQGFPNADPSCGPKHSSGVLNLTGCTGSLPVKITGATQGNAADYGNYYSFNLQPTGGQLLRNLYAQLRGFDGRPAGHVKVPVLFGNLRVSIPLRYGIAPSRYHLIVSGYANGRPVSCGPLQAGRVLSFH